MLARIPAFEVASSRVIALYTVMPSGLSDDFPAPVCVSRLSAESVSKLATIWKRWLSPYDVDRCGFDEGKASATAFLPNEFEIEVARSARKHYTTYRDHSLPLRWRVVTRGAPGGPDGCGQAKADPFPNPRTARRFVFHRRQVDFTRLVHAL